MRNFVYFFAAFTLLSILALFGLLPDFVTPWILLGYSFLFLVSLSGPFFIRFLLMLAYYSISLSLFYYLFGLNKYSISVWLLLSAAGHLYFVFKRQPKFFYWDFSFIKKIKSQCNDYFFWITILGVGYFLFRLFSHPILDGQPSPWHIFSFWDFVIFFVLSLLLIYRAIFFKNSILASLLYFFLLICPLAASYILSYGYDTLLHQAALKEIMASGRVWPLTPFYIGQYSLEILASFFKVGSLVSMERWLVPILFWLSAFWGGHYFLGRLKIKGDYLLPALAALFLLPSIFTYTSPYAFSLLWGVLAVIFLFLSDFKTALWCSLASFFVHPFIGLNILFWTAIFIYFKAKKVNILKSRLRLFILFLISVMLLPLAFMAYNWLNNNAINIYNPLYFLANFATVFTDPAWYVRDGYHWLLGLIYFYEWINLFFFFFLLLYYPLKKLSPARDILFLVAFSVFISAWLFVSSFKIDNYFYGDQVNYAYRLVQASKWILWPILLIFLAHAFGYIKNKGRLIRWAFIIFLSLISTISWYLTYPRQDAISRMNVNSIRQVDFQAVDFIYAHAGGKNDYLVLANQIIGAGAVLRHGFGPYYQTASENMLYYSLPWGGTLSQWYNRIMDAGSRDIDPYLREIYKIMETAKLNKFYFVHTDAWAPDPKVVRQLQEKSFDYWQIDHKVFIYLFIKD